MSNVNPNHVISISATKFPQNLLIPNVDNSVSFQVTNQSTKEEHFKFVFEGENLELEVKPVEFLDEILFKSGEIKNIDLQLKPTTNGIGKLTVNAYWMKLVEYTVKVQKVRDKISSSRIGQILKDKQFLQSVKHDSFNPKDFIITSDKDDIKKIEKQIKESTANSAESQNNSQSSSVPKGEIAANLTILAKSYLSIGEFYKALESSLQLTNEVEKIDLYYNLIRANATINLENTLQAIKDLNEVKKKNLVAKNIALDYVKIDPDQVIKILSLIEEDSLKENALFEVIFMSLEKDPGLALKFSEFIKDETVKIKVLFNIIKKLHENKNNSLILKILNQIDEIILKSKKINLSTDPNYHNPAYKYFKETICILAELDCPEAADKVIEGLSSEKLKKSIAKDLFNEIYKMVEEKQTKVEPIGEFSQFFLLNTYISPITKEVNDFSLIGGNVSSNILRGNFNFNIALISLFSFDFSIFPIIDRVYSELNHNSKRSISYYIYPSISDHNKEELKIIQTTLKKFFQPESIKNRVTVFNLDFIPYLGKPSVILSSINEDVNIIKSKIVKSLGDRVHVIIDDDLFKGGKTVESLNSIFYGSNFNIVNLILSYEFINDYDIFKTFVQSLT
ncbi:MAG: hypothetical protein KGD61_07160 [Candidatus Lokiarchaeota archaeon]|nr:hypothetical protein [Candidatus Lokiarchaeota archaeon]